MKETGIGSGEISRDAGAEDLIEVTKSPEGRKDIEVTFLYVTHTLENVDEIYEKARGADKILIEGAETTKSERVVKTHLHNTFLEAAREHSKDPDVARYIEALREREAFDSHLVAKILEEGEVKEIGYVDITEDEPTHRGVAQALELLERINDFVRAGRLREAYAAPFQDFIESFAVSSAAREEIVLKQLEQEFKNSEEGGEKIVVIQGAAHTPTYHAFKRKGIPTQRDFVPKPLTFSPTQALFRKRRFFPEAQISDEEYLRAFVGDFLIIPGATAIWPEATPHELDAFANKILKRLSVDEINENVDQFARMRERRSGLGPTPLGRLAEALKAEERELRSDRAQIVRELAERHGMSLERKIT